MGTTVSNPSIPQDEPVGAGNAQDKHTGRESTTLPHPVVSPEPTLDDAETSLKGKTYPIKAAIDRSWFDSDGSGGEIDSTGKRIKIIWRFMVDSAGYEHLILVPTDELIYFESFFLFSLCETLRISETYRCKDYVSFVLQSKDDHFPLPLDYLLNRIEIYEELIDEIDLKIALKIC